MTRNHIYLKNFFIDESIDVPPLENLPDLSEFPSGSQGQDQPVLILFISLAAINTHLLS